MVWHIRHNRSLVFGIIAACYFFLMDPPPGGVGPEFAATHFRAMAGADSSPLSRSARTVRYVLWFFVIIRRIGSKSSAVAEVEEASCRSDPMESAGSSGQYAV